MSDKLFLYLAAVPVLGVLAQLLSHWLRLPGILLLLTFGLLLGMVANPDVLLEEITGSEKAGPAILFPLVSLAVAIILFEGGLTLKIAELRNVGSAVFRMVTIGAAVSCLLTTLAAWQLLGMDWRIALLLGAVLVVTGPTVIAPLIRHIRPSRKIGSILKWEGIVIDPIGAVLAVLVFEQVIHASSETPILSAIWTFLSTAILGVTLAWFLSRVLAIMMQRFLIPDFLHGVVFLAVALGSFAFSNWIIHESGLVTVTALGIFLANQKTISIGHVVEFKENLGILLISCLFIVLGSRLDLAQLLGHGAGAILFVLLLIVVIRPASILIALMGTRTPWREQLFLSLVAPRGIVAAAVISIFALKVLATADHEPHLESLVESARKLEPATFLVIVSTVAIYGLSAAPLARKLGLADTNPQGILFAGASSWVRDLALAVSKAGFPVLVADTNYSNVSAARQQGLNAVCASILSEEVAERLEFSGIGRLFAVTSNDEINDLAVGEFMHHFGRMNVYRLPTNDIRKGVRASLAGRIRGRVVMADCTESELSKRFSSGWKFKSTRISKEFRGEDFQQMYGKEAIVVMYADVNRKLHIVATEAPWKAAEGQLVIYLARTTETA